MCESPDSKTMFCEGGKNNMLQMRQPNNIVQIFLFINEHRLSENGYKDINMHNTNSREPQLAYLLLHK